jgi:hypothetical protein
MATSTPEPQSNPPDPQTNGDWRWGLLGQPRLGTFARKDPAAFQEYTAYRAQAETALYEKYYAEQVSNFGENASTVEARKDAIIDASAAANQQFAIKIASAGAGTLVSTPITQPVLPQQPQPPSGPVTPVNPAANPQTPGESRLINTADDLLGPVSPDANPQIPAAAPTPPPGRPLLPLRNDGGSFNQQVGDVREDGAVLTQFLDANTPVFVIRPGATTPPPVAPDANPQVPDGSLPEEQASPAAPAVSPAVDPQVPAAPALPRRGPLPTITLDGLLITDQSDLIAYEEALNRVLESNQDLFNARLRRPRDPDLIDAVQEQLDFRQRIRANIRKEVVDRARVAAAQAQVANLLVPDGSLPEEQASPGALSNAPVDPGVNPQVPASPAAPAQQAVSIGDGGAAARAAQEQAARNNARAQAQLQAQKAQAAGGDWRLKLRLAPGSDYLYNAGEPGILQPLKVTEGVIFPYTPTIATTYTAQYNNYDLTHSNYRGYFYQGSHVGELTITATFTAQDSNEAAYLLAVIQFFRSVTKMFYGQQDAFRGSPPPLVFLQGYGEFQFNLNPCVVQTFNYTLPADVDYIRAGAPNINGTSLLQRRDRQTTTVGSSNPSTGRMSAAGLSPGGTRPAPPPVTLGRAQPTYVPTKMEMTIVLLPMQTRSQVSREFSMERFANGSLVQRGFW